MDSDRFDELSRALATRRSRRAVLGAIGAALAGLVTGQAASAAPKKAKPSKCYGGGSHCTNGKQCCSGICSNRQCVAEIEPECTTAADCPAVAGDCQAATCVEGVCGVENVAAGTGCDGGVCDGNGGCAGCLSGGDCASGICDNGACVPSCEELPDFGTPCTAGLGACLRDGVYVCAPDGISLMCNAAPGQGSQEICNGIDDDCDGMIDEGAVCPSVPHAVSGCVEGRCEIVYCEYGYTNCTGNPADGCECPADAVCESARCCIAKGEEVRATIPCCSGEAFLGVCQ